MSFYSSEYLAIERKKWIDTLDTVQYYENGSWKTAEINSKTVSGTDLIILAYAQSSGSAGTITGIRVYDHNGVLAGSETTSLGRAATKNALLRIVLPIKEV